MLTLAIGDLFIPERSIDIPQKFKKLLAPNPQSKPSNSKVNRVVCLGNIINSTSTLQFLNNISPNFEIVKGEYDDAGLVSQQLQLIAGSELKTASANSAIKVPMYSRFVHDNLKIGFTSGHQIVPRGDPLALSAFARELDVDVLIWGGTHRVEAYTLDGKFFVNPGSATGAFNFDWPEFEEDDEEDDKEEEEEEEEEEDEEGRDGTEGKGREATEEKTTKDGMHSKNVDNKETNETNETKGSTGNEGKQEPENGDESKQDDSGKDFKNSLDDATELNTNIPSFCILDTKGSTCILYIYTYFNNEVKVDKVTYNKE
ncbi:VPS29 [Candida theae]|uniref:Vacuolar protein sorting-associated protein 29 n=1 Tax=Candida theae TaxID=1198502 RepID=A0AAD5BIN3_9ASCO|nr:VPS29 [Candida theae]KAI5966673.1 VPS29 [Candida theae]